MKRETYESPSDTTLWGLAADAYSRQWDSNDPNYINKQLSIVYGCLEVIFDRLDRGEKRETFGN